MRHAAMEIKGRGSDEDALERAHSDELAFLRKLTDQALSSLIRMRRRPASSSPWPFAEADDDDEDFTR